MLVLEELMKLYSSSNSSELRNLSTIIVEIMVSICIADVTVLILQYYVADPL